jgi:hypothetical protein
MRLVMPLVLLLTACGSAPAHRTPSTIATVVVETPRKLPDWATSPLPKPEAADHSVRAHLTDEDERGSVIDLANCHRLLLRKLENGEPVTTDECERQK